MAAGEVLRVDRSVSLLVATGASICGVSAVMAAAPVVEEDGASASKVSVALATVMVFGIASMFLYPIMWQRLPGPVSARAMGIYTGWLVMGRWVVQLLVAKAVGNALHFLLLGPC